MISGISKDDNAATAKINTASLMEGVRCLEVDPVNGNTVVETYGGQVGGFGFPRFLMIPFIWRFAAAFDSGIAVCEYHMDAANSNRRITMGTDVLLDIQDDEGDQIGRGTNALSGNKDYPVRWYIDLIGTTR